MDVYHLYNVTTMLQVVFARCAGWYHLNSSPLQYRSTLIATRMGKMYLLTYAWLMAKHFYRFSKFCQYFTKIRIVISDNYRSYIIYPVFI